MLAVRSPSEMKILLIHNPNAGIGEHSGEKLTRLLAKTGDVTYRSVKSKRWMTAFDEEPADLIVAAGGDGTVRKVALHAPRGSRMAIVPLGTANNVARSLGISGRPKDVVASWKSARWQPLDLGYALGPWGERPFLEGVGIGAVTRTAARMDTGEPESDGTSPIKQARKLLQAALANGSSSWFDVSVDGQSISERAVLLEIANMPYIGPRLALAPMADPGDGELDIVWLPEDGRKDLRDWLADASAEDNEAPVRICRGSRIQIHHATGQFRIDDQYWPPQPDPEHADTTSDIDISVIGGALSVLVPQGSPERPR